MFEVYRADIYRKLGTVNMDTPVEDYTKVEKDIKLKEIFIFDLDSSILKINSYPNEETDTKTFKIDCIKKINDSITIKSKINLNKKGVSYLFTSDFNINEDNSYINLLFYDVINNESTFINVSHFSYKK
jgi:hypothetical protein